MANKHMALVNRKIILATLVGIAVGSLLLQKVKTDAANKQAKPDQPTNSLSKNASQQTIRNFLATNCIECHSGEEPEGKLSLAGVKAFADLKSAVWTKIRERIHVGEMPPDYADQPTAAARQFAVDWIGRELQKSGAIVEDKLTLPNYGNYVDHDTLFHQKPTLAPATKARLWRIRPGVYGTLVPGIQPFSMIPGHQISDYSALFTVDESAVEIILRNAQKLVEQQTSFKVENGKIVPVSRKTDKRFLPLLDAKNPPSEEQMQEAIAYQFQRVLDRTPTEKELAKITGLWKRIAKDVSHLHGVRAALTVPFLKPEAVYRLELGSGKLDEHGRRRLSPKDIAVAISFALSDKRPNRYNQWLVAQAAAKDQLKTREEVAKVVEQLLNQPLHKTPRVLEFFDEYFDYEKAVGVFKEKPSFANELVRDTRDLIEHLVEQDKNVLYELLTTDKVTIRREDLAYIYGLSPDYKATGEKFVKLPGMRAGILMQPSWLIAHSTNFDNDPVRRGKWIRERLLGGTVPDIPISVDAVVPDDPDKTLRERFMVTQKAYCWNCHKRMNPLGMPFEAFDPYAKLRIKELGKPVDTRGAITNSGDKDLDGPVKGPFELIEKLASSKRTQEVFVRYAFRYFLGRNETLRDAKTLQDANRAYEESGGSFKALVVSLLSSDSFLYRINPEVDALTKTEE